jgi:DNA-binding NtrC family response regulator
MKNGTNVSAITSHLMEADTTRHTILVVEDEALLRMCAVSVLEDAGYAVLEAEDGDAALEMIAGHDEIGVVITDVRMPGTMSGLALVSRIKKERPEIRSIVVSGNAAAREAFNVGASGFLPKPFLGDAIVNAVENTLRGH